MAVELSKLTDEDLMALVQQSNQTAFSVLVKRYAQRFYTLAYRTLFNQSEAEDIVQEAFLKIWHKPFSWDAKKNTKFTTWFYRIVVNSCYDHNKKKKPLTCSLTEPFDMPMADLNSCESVQETQLALLDIAIKQLPERQRIALNLCFYEGLSNAEAALIMGLKLKALQSLVMRARTTLKAILKTQVDALNGELS